MCGRFTIISNPVVYQMEFDIKLDEDIKQEWKQRYNVAPTQSIPVLESGAARSVSMMQWGLLPIWAARNKKPFSLINVRAETIREKPYFKGLVERGKRCLIFADGFYEWQPPAGKGMLKTPYYFHRKDNKPFAFAGVWESSPSGEQSLNTCAIITCPPNPLVAEAHNRMPVMLEPAAGREWLAQKPVNDLLAMLAPFPADAMQAFPVGRLVNNPSADSPQCILPAQS